jgi:hypothetical protein
MYDNLDQWLKAELHGFAPAPTQKEPAGQLLKVLRQVQAYPTSKASKAKASAALEQIHALAKTLLERWTWDDEVKESLEKCVALRPRQAIRAVDLHETLGDFVVDAIKGCGRIDPEFLGILIAIMDFVDPLGWGIGIGGWQGPDL